MTRKPAIAPSGPAYTVAAAFLTAGIPARVDWQIGEYGRVLLGKDGQGIAEVRIIKGRAILPRAEQDRYGHGLARLPSHPDYPAPNRSPYVERILSVLRTVDPTKAPATLDNPLTVAHE